MKTLLFILALLAPIAGRAQTYSINWHKIAGGGGSSTSAVYQVTGTIGQAEAGMTMSGGPYSVAGGFWSQVFVVQTAGLPNLAITRSGGRIIVSWPDTDGATLQQNNALAGGSWAASSYTITTAGGTNTVTIVAPAGNSFFRLVR